MKNILKTYCELHWWNGGAKTLNFRGTLKDLLTHQSITYTKTKTDHEGLYTFIFRTQSGITFKTLSTIQGFADSAKRIVQMELVHMGDKSRLYVQGAFRPTVTVNF